MLLNLLNTLVLMNASIIRDWVNMYHSPNAGKDSTKAFHMFVQQMNMHGLLKTDDLITR